MGARGPAGKRSTELMGHGAAKARDEQVTKVDVDQIAITVEAPAADESWHEVAKVWYNSLRTSAQRMFYEPSDWAMAYVIAESLSRDMSDQVVGIAPESGEVLYAEIPLKGASLSAYLKAMSMLLVSEADRRRARIEITRAGATEEDASPTTVEDLLAARERGEV